MRHRVRGFSLVEVLLALAVGLVLVLGVSQVVISSRATHASQQAAMLLQDDARFVLGKIVRTFARRACLAAWPRRLSTTLQQPLISLSAGRLRRV